MLLTLFILSLFGGFLSGLIGLGGAVVMIPLMLTVPSLLGVGDLGMKAVSGLSMIQVLFAASSGLIIHRKNRYVNLETLYLAGIPMGIFSLAGSYFSGSLSNLLVMVIFAVMVLIALVLLILQKTGKEQPATPGTPALPLADSITVNKPAAVLLGAGVGTLSGIVGAGGGFIMVPLLMMVLKLPLRVTVGTSLGIVFIGALFGSFGKVLSSQVDFSLVLPVVAGSLIAGQFGARVSRKTPAGVLKICLIGAVVLSLVQVVFKIAGEL